MKFNVTIEKALSEQTGVSKSSGKPWRKRGYVAVYDASNPRYLKRIVFDVVGDKVDELAMVEGGQYEVEVDFDAREWNGRYFLSASCWRATRLDNVAPAAAAPVATDPYAAAGLPQAQPSYPADAASSSDLPF